MKKLALSVICFLFLVGAGFAQEFAALKDYPLTAKEDYRKAEEKALECSHYLITHPLNSSDYNRPHAVQFLLRRMEGTPDYSFTMDEIAIKLSKSNNDLLSVYIAHMTEYTIYTAYKYGYKINDPDHIKAVKLYAISALLVYCEDSANKVKLDKELKKMIEAKNKGQLKEYLKI